MKCFLLLWLLFTGTTVVLNIMLYQSMLINHRIMTDLQKNYHYTLYSLVSVKWCDYLGVYGI